MFRAGKHSKLPAIARTSHDQPVDLASRMSECVCVCVFKLRERERERERERVGIARK